MIHAYICYDHNWVPAFASMTDVCSALHYSHNNPVQRGLVAEPGKWRWSSYNCYQGVEDVPLVVDKFEV